MFVVVVVVVVVVVAAVVVGGGGVTADCNWLKLMLLLLLRVYCWCRYCCCCCCRFLVLLPVSVLVLRASSNRKNLLLSSRSFDLSVLLLCCQSYHCLIPDRRVLNIIFDVVAINDAVVSGTVQSFFLCSFL